MFGRKKYRKGRKYTYVVSGTYNSGKNGPGQDRLFLSANTLLITNSMDPLEMFNEVLRHVKIAQEVKPDHNVFLNSYHVESN
jgi:hypothetical protein